MMLDDRKSGSTADGENGVVGHPPLGLPESEGPGYTLDERKQLLELARQSLQHAATSGRPPDLDLAGFPPKLRETKGCFVTLTRGARLRGCVGHLFPKTSLLQAVVDNTQSAALRDHRFPPVTSDEVASLAIEISVLTEPKPLEFSSPDDLLARLQPGRDGVVLRVRSSTATYLPQVWEKLPDKTAFLNSLSEKAGCPASAWREPGTTVLIYRVEAFQEAGFR